MSPEDDGRNIDPRLGRLGGEAADQAVRAGDRGRGEGAMPYQVWRGAPAGAAGREEPTYYDRPVIKEPVWKPTIAVYFWLGGAAGASATLAAACQLTAGRRLRGLVERCRWTSFACCLASTAFLIDDLGRPSRFLNMLRVFRPSSPMSVGSWVLAGASSTIGPAALHTRDRSPLHHLGEAGGVVAGVLGLPLAGYTAVLLNNTVVPVWWATHRTLPPFFVASGATAASSMLDLLPLQPHERRVVRRFGLGARLAELALAKAVEREADRVPRVGAPLHRGFAGALWRAGTVLTAASAVLTLFSRRRGARIGAGVLGNLGPLAARFALFYAGRASARDPLATHRQQAAGEGGEALTGRAGVVGPRGERATD